MTRSACRGIELEVVTDLGGAWGTSQGGRILVLVGLIIAALEAIGDEKVSQAA